MKNNVKKMNETSFEIFSKHEKHNWLINGRMSLPTDQDIQAHLVNLVNFYGIDAVLNNFGQLIKKKTA